jgi:hypothetical protein
MEKLEFILNYLKEKDYNFFHFKDNKTKEIIVIKTNIPDIILNISFIRKSEDIIIFKNANYIKGNYTSLNTYYFNLVNDISNYYCCTYIGENNISIKNEDILILEKGET